jgi:hypothetical protein
LFRWFVGLNLDDPVWDATVFTKKPRAFAASGGGPEISVRVVTHARQQGWTSDEHFTMDGTLLHRLASLKSFEPKDKPDWSPPDDAGNPAVNFHGEKRSNATHESRPDPEARLARKGAGKEAKLSYSGNLLVENRHWLIIEGRIWEATGMAERYAAGHAAAHSWRSPSDRRMLWLAEDNRVVAPKYVIAER